MRTMFLKPLLRLLRDRQFTALQGVAAQLKPFYRLTFLAAAAEAGLLARLAAGPATLDSLAEFFAARGQGRDALEAWLQIGVRLRLLKREPRGYALSGLASARPAPQRFHARPGGGSGGAAP